MDDDVLVRAITIGASIFITLATVTAIMMYYNTARQAVTAIGPGTNLEANYREDIKKILYNTQASGSEVKNILQYFYDNHEVSITIDKYIAYDPLGSTTVDIPISDENNINYSKSSTYTNIMKNMMPNQKFKITSSGQTYTFTLII